NTVAMPPFKLVMILALIDTVVTQYAHITMDIDFDNSGVKFKEQHQKFVNDESGKRENGSDVSDFIIPAQNLTLYAHVFPFEDTEESRVPDLLRDFNEGICRFKHHRLPIGRFFLDDMHNRSMRTSVKLRSSMKTYLVDTLSNHGFLYDEYYDREFVESAQLPADSPSHFFLAPPSEWGIDLSRSFIQYKPRVSLVSCPTYKALRSMCKKFTTEPVECK
ncbi:hypothetical protein PMAYCL1PPCAC_00207, partial [Pristionchus mayeri]